MLPRLPLCTLAVWVLSLPSCRRHPQTAQQRKPPPHTQYPPPLFPPPTPFPSPTSGRGIHSLLHSPHHAKHLHSQRSTQRSVAMRSCLTTLRALRHLQLAHKHLATTRILRVAGRTTSERDRPHPGRHSHVAPWCHQLQLGHRHRDGHDSHGPRLQIMVPAAPAKTGQTRDDMSSPAGSQPPPAAPAHTLRENSPREAQQLLPRDGRIAHGLRLEATIPDTSSANRAQCH
jgi:hypothetical protein